MIEIVSHSKHHPVRSVTEGSDMSRSTMTAMLKTENDMTPSEIVKRRIELDLTVDEMAFALNLSEAELMAIEAGESRQHLTREFVEAWEVLEERAFGLTVGA